MTTISNDSMTCVQNDFCPAGVGNWYDYSTPMTQDMALKVPLGSQLALLNAQNAGNPYVQYNATGFQKLGSLENVLMGYNTMGQTIPGGGTYYSFSNAYGRF